MNTGTTPVLQFLRRATQAAERKVELGVAHLGVTARQLTLLSIIAKNPKANQTDLVYATGVDRSTVADIMRRLSDRGWVTRTRNKVDTRAYELSLTAEGRAILKAAEPITTRIEASILSQLPARGQDDLVRHLQAIADRGAAEERSTTRHRG